MPVTSWSTTASNNATADSASGINLAEGQAPSSLNDSMRSLMAVIKGDFANSLANPGYQKFPNGLIVQWGSSVVTLDANSNGQINFPTAFPTAAYTVIPSVGDFASSTTVPIGVMNYASLLTTAKFQFAYRPSAASTGVRVNWVAFGS